MFDPLIANKIIAVVVFGYIIPLLVFYLFTVFSVLPFMSFKHYFNKIYLKIHLQFSYWFLVILLYLIILVIVLGIKKYIYIFNFSTVYLQLYITPC